jgi:hypothetical protein
VAIAIAVFGHAWGIARTDDWAFARVAFALHDTGHLRLVGWAQMNLVGLVAWAQPWLWVFGDHMWVVALSAATLVGIGLGAFYRLARAMLPRTLALLAVSAIVFYPGFLRDIPTFMTDAPALAVQAIALAVGARALSSAGRRRVVLLAVVVAIGFFGFTIREFAICAPLAVLGAAFLDDRAARRRLAMVMLGFVAVCGAFYVWRTGLPGTQKLHGGSTLSVETIIAVRAACTVSLSLVPVLVWTIRSWWPPIHTRARFLGSALGASAVTLAVAVPRSAQHILVGDYIQARGVNGLLDVLGTRPALVPQPVWAAVVVVSILATVLIAGRLAECAAVRLRDHDARSRMLALHLAGVVGACMFAAVLNGQLFDRYLWPIALSAPILMLRRYQPHKSYRLRPIGFVALGVLALAIALNSAAFDGARWQAGQALVRSGLPAASIDAGWEWTGAHATGPAHPDGNFTSVGAVSWWSTWFDHPTTCALVTASPIDAPGYVLTGSRSWNLVLFAVPEKLLIYRSLSPDCPAASVG